MCLASNIRYLRKTREMTQDQLAEALGYKSYTTIQKWETGISEPPLKVVRKMADLFNVDINDMTGKRLDLAGGISYHQNEYYINDETAQIAQEIFENKELRGLFDVARKASASDLQTAYDVLLALKRKEGYSGDDPA